MNTYTIVGTGRVVATVRAETETEALAEWAQIRRALAGRRLAPHVELIVEGDKPKIFEDAGTVLTDRHAPA